MADFIQSMGTPFLACLLLAGIHVYLGIHVISRKVIFVDLALAQIAALGAVAGMLLGYGFREDPWAIKGFSLAFAVIGAAVFSLTRMKHERVPQEAIIGITYAVALAVALLAADRLPHGPSALKALLEGSIVYVDGATVLWTGLLYGAVGLFHWIYRKPFLAISLDPEGAAASGIRVRLWDFLFYVSFGFVVTSSVAIAGVLLVFSFLVIPAVIGVLFARGIGGRLLIGWLVGTLVSFAGGTISYYGDLPNGPTIVVTFALALIVAGLVYYLGHAPSRGAGLLRIAGGAVCVGLLVAAGLAIRKHDEHTLIGLLQSEVKNEQLIGIRQAQEDPGLWESIRGEIPVLLHDDDAEVRCETIEAIGRRGDVEFLGEVHSLLTDPDEFVREDAIECVRHLARPESVEPLLSAVAMERDEYLRAELGEAVLELHDPRGLPVLIEVMDRGEHAQVRRDAFEHLSAHTELGFGFDAAEGPDENDAQVAPFREWWEANRERIRLRPGTLIYEVLE